MRIVAMPGVWEKFGVSIDFAPIYDVQLFDPVSPPAKNSVRLPLWQQAY
jgi:hypothetical protein